MRDGDVLVPRESAVYQEFARLYLLARSLRPTDVDRWNGKLYATTDQQDWGSFVPQTGDLRMSEQLVLRHLTGPTAETTPRRKAQALATILHEATHAGMRTDAPTEPNAVRSLHSLGLMEGFAELRTVNDFELFTASAGYPGLKLSSPQYLGAYTATSELVEQVSGPAKNRRAFIAEATVGPASMHFDQLADSVVQNRLGESVPRRPQDQRAVRAALIETMLHPQWPSLPRASVRAGQLVAEDIRPRLNAKVDEIRHHYQASPHQTFPTDSPNQYAVGLAAEGRADPAARRQQSADGERPVETMRFLSGQAPAGGAVRGGASVGDGSRRAGVAAVPSVSRPGVGRGRN